MTIANLYSGPIIDSHLHLFDPHRPQGIPWPEPGNNDRLALLCGTFPPAP